MMTTRSFRMSAAVAGCALVALLASNASAVVVADSAVDFSGTQGQNNWTNGYHNVTANGAYDAGDFIEFGPGGNPGFVFGAGKWDWGAGNPPWTEVSATGGHPNGTNNAGSGGEQWVVRRWTSEVEGAVNIDMQLRKTNTGGGNGTIVRTFVNGAEQASFAVAGTDGVGRTCTFHVPDLNVGDFVDVVLDANGSDGFDGSAFSGVVNHVTPNGSTLIADSITEFSGTQGSNGWFNGYHNVTANGPYDAGDFIEFGPGGDPGFVLVGGGTRWDWGAGNPPWTTIDADDGHPNGTNNAGSGGEQWAIRRYQVEEGGDLLIDAFLAAQNTNGGNGTILHILHNGTEIGSLIVGGTDGVGLRDVFSVLGAQAGDFIDLALDSNGPDGSDGSFFSARIYRLNTVPEPASAALFLLASGALGIRRRRRA